MSRSSLPMGTGDTPRPALPMALSARWVHSLIGEKNVPEARCLSRLQGGLWPWVAGVGLAGGRGHLRASGRGVSGTGPKEAGAV